MTTRNRIAGCHKATLLQSYRHPTFGYRASGMSERSYLTTEEYYALPKQARLYIRDLETRCDPSGDIRTIAVLREQRKHLLKLVEGAGSRTSHVHGGSAPRTSVSSQGSRRRSAMRTCSSRAEMPACTSLHIR